MKKSIFTLLVVALAAPMMFNSCKGGGDDPTPTPSDLPVPPKAADAIKVVINPPGSSQGCSSRQGNYQPSFKQAYI